MWIDTFWTSLYVERLLRPALFAIPLWRVVCHSEKTLLASQYMYKNQPIRCYWAVCLLKRPSVQDFYRYCKVFNLPTELAWNIFNGRPNFSLDRNFGDLFFSCQRRILHNKQLYITQIGVYSIVIAWPWSCAVI